jgi:prolyl 4-hydroxylase
MMQCCLGFVFAVVAPVYAVVALFANVAIADSSRSDGNRNQVCVSQESESCSASDSQQNSGLEKAALLEEIASRYGVKQYMKEYDPSYLLKVDEYFQNVVMKEDKYSSVRNYCRNENEYCTYWASVGECDTNPAYMHTTCALACLACHLLIYEQRCPFPESLSDAWQAGDLNKLFQRITMDPQYQQYKPNVICKPGMTNPRTGDCPWIVTLEDFLTEHECETLIELGAVSGFKRSVDVRLDPTKTDGSYQYTEYDGRTSATAWCLEDCYNNATAMQVIERIANLTGIPDANAEFLQLLRYEVGQFYRPHHDYIDSGSVKRLQGPRILTVFLYLNDVEAGGATHFSDLDISVYPKRGRVL